MAYLQLVIILLYVASIVQGDPIEVTLCDEVSSPAVGFSNLNIRPIPIKLGSYASISLTAHSKVPTEPGTRVEISASYFLFSFACPKYQPFCIDVCKELERNSSTCSKPNGAKCGNCVLPPGDYNIFYEVPTPNVPMTGKGKIKVKVFNKSNTLLACGEGEVAFG